MAFYKGKLDLSFTTIMGVIKGELRKYEGDIESQTTMLQDIYDESYSLLKSAKREEKKSWWQVWK